MMDLKITEILCYLLCCFCANTISGDVNLTASGNFADSTYVVQIGSSVTLTCSNSDKTTPVTILDKDGVLGSCTVFMGTFTCNTGLYTVDQSDANFNFFKYIISSFQTSHCGTYKCELGSNVSVSSSINVEHEVYYDDPCGSTCGTCEVNTFECQASTNKCVCKGNTIPDPDNSTKCITVPSTTSPPVPSTTSTSYTPTNTTTNMPTGTSTSNSSDNRLSDGAIGGIVGGLSSLILVATAVTIYCCRKHNGQKKQGDIDLQLEKQDNKM